MAAQGEPKMSEREDPGEELDLQLTEENESELHLPSGHRTTDSEESDGSSTSPGQQCQCEELDLQLTEENESELHLPSGHRTPDSEESDGSSTSPGQQCQCEELDLQLTEENESELHLPSGHRTTDSEESDGSSTSPGQQCQCEELDLQLTEENESELHLPSGHRTTDSEESDGSSTSLGQQCQCVFRQTLLPEPDQKFMTMCQEHFHLMMQQEPQQQPAGQQQATGVQLPPDVQLQASMVSTVVWLPVYLEGPAHDPQASNSNESKAHFELICCDSTVFQPAEGTVEENDILHPIAPVSPTGHPQHVGFLHTAQSFNAPSADEDAAPAGGFTPRAAEMVSVEEITEAAAYQTVGVAEAIKVSDTAGANDAEIITGEVINQLVAKAQVATSSAVEQVERVIKAADIINTTLVNMVEASNAAKSLVLEINILAEEARAEAERLIEVAEATEGEAAAAQEAVVKTAGAAMVEGADTAAVEGSTKAALYTSAARATKKVAIVVQLQALALVIAEDTKAEVKTFEAILKCIEIQVERATKYAKNAERARVAIASFGTEDEMTTEIEEITTEVAYLNACAADVQWL